MELLQCVVGICFSCIGLCATRHRPLNPLTRNPRVRIAAVAVRGNTSLGDPVRMNQRRGGSLRVDVGVFWRYRGGIP